MSKKQLPASPASAVPPAPAAPDYSNCPYWGRGGRYVYDPQTGRRTPVDVAQVEGDTAAPQESETFNRED